MPLLVLKISHDTYQRVRLDTPYGPIYVRNLHEEKRLAFEAPLKVNIRREYLHSDGVWREHKEKNADGE